MSNYSNAGTKNYTMIEDLLDLDGPGETRKNGIPPGMLPDGAEKYAKFIRQPHQSKYEEHYTHPPSQAPPGISPNPYQQPMMMQQHIPYGIPHHSPYSCLDIAGHIENCPICSKFYNNDKSCYIIAIIILLVIVVVLLKKVLDI